VIRLDRLVAGLAAEIFRYAVPSPGRRLAEARAIQFSWSTRHQSVVTDEVHAVISPALQRLRARFGLDVAAEATPLATEEAASAEAP
jgi:hypothetical protein